MAAITRLHFLATDVHDALSRVLAAARLASLQIFGVAAERGADGSYAIELSLEPTPYDSLWLLVHRIERILGVTDIKIGPPVMPPDLDK